MLLWLALACGGSSEEAEPVVLDTGDSLPSDYVVAEEESSILLALEEIATGIEEGLVTMRLLDPSQIQSHYLALIEDADESCPEWKQNYYEANTYNYWKDSCTSQEGTVFSGWAKQQRPMEFQSGNHHYTDDGFIEGEFKIEQPGGVRLEFSGRISYWERILNFYRYPDDPDYEKDYSVSSYGDVTLSSASGDENTWLSKSYVYDYSSYFKDYDDGEGMAASWDGGVFGIDGDAPAIYATDFYIYSSAKGSSCDLEPSGLISIRDTLGQWYDVEFQGPPYAGAWAYQPECDGCGSAWFRGDYLGEVCVDFDIFMEWDGEGRPW